MRFIQTKFAILFINFSGIKSFDAYQKYPVIVNRLRAVNSRLSASTSAAVALIFKGLSTVVHVCLRFRLHAFKLYY